MSSEHSDTNPSVIARADPEVLKLLCSQSPTCRFFERKSLLITGVTGFCGKVLLEKIVRTLFNVPRVYLLLRSKPGQSVQQRLDELLNSPVFSFNKLDKQQLKKLVAIGGDLSRPDLGLKDADKRLLCSEVQIVYHVAASVKFDASFRYNFEQNTLGTKHLVDLCEQFHFLEQFVYVSTAYANCHLKDVGEHVYPMNKDVDQLIELFNEISDDQQLEEIAKDYYEGRPNSYVFTKALAELYVDKHRLRPRDANSNRAQEMPPVLSSIIRPAIVYNSQSEPTFGWIDSWNGPAAFSMFIFSGLIRRPDFGFTSKWQIIPVDFVANVLLCVPLWIQNASQEINSLPASQSYVQERTPHPLPVLNLSLGDYIPGKMHDLLMHGERYTRLYPSLYITRPIVVPPAKFNVNPWMHRFQVFFSETLYFCFCDALLGVAGFSSYFSFRRLYRRYRRACNLMRYFIVNDWNFDTKQYEALVRDQHPLDRILFNMDMKSCDLDMISKSYVLGCRRFLLREPDSSIRNARLKYACIFGVRQNLHLINRFHQHFSSDQMLIK